MLQDCNQTFNIKKDSIVLFYFLIDEKINNETIQLLISTFPVFEQHFFNSIQDKEAQKRTLFGRIILRFIATRLGLARSEKYVRLTSSGKPVFIFPNGFNFNISHSGSMVLCCVSKDCSVGIDIEENRPINLEHYRNYFDSTEWQYIIESENRELTFLKLWVRKESVIKADGRGIGIELFSFNCLNNKTNLETTTYFIQDIDLKLEYICAIACNKKKTITLKDFKEIYLTEYRIGFNNLSLNQVYEKI
jgi:4'-phosphopantetheinyl transferase